MKGTVKEAFEERAVENGSLSAEGMRQLLVSFRDDLLISVESQIKDVRSDISVLQNNFGRADHTNVREDEQAIADDDVFFVDETLDEDQKKMFGFCCVVLSFL